MKIKPVVSAILAIFLTTGGSAFAQGQGYGDRGDRGDRNRDQQSQRDNQQDRRDYQQGRDYNDRRHEGRGVGPNHQYYKGDRLPAEYRHRNYVVDDWRGHHLSAPPRGYHWVQSGSDYVLVAIATGIIAQLLLDHY